MNPEGQIESGETSASVPSGLSLKAAYLLLRELNKSPEPPTMESVALLLDKVLRYPHIITLLRDAHGDVICRFKVPHHLTPIRLM
jgi:hypothetical protein